MSKRGSPFLRLVVWQAAFTASRVGPQLRAYFQNKRGEGKTHGTAIGAICRELPYRIYIVPKKVRGSGPEHLTRLLEDVDFVQYGQTLGQSIIAGPAVTVSAGHN